MTSLTHSGADTGPVAQAFSFRPPLPTDAAAMHRLVEQSPPLDPNSLYCNLLQCSDFADTAVVALAEGRLQGFITGYVPPKRPDTLFVWQVAVAAEARGHGLAKSMLGQLFTRVCAEHGVTYIDTTVTPDNEASMALFHSFAEQTGADISQQVLFQRDAHFEGQHDDEVLLHIGPMGNYARTH